MYTNNGSSIFSSRLEIPFNIRQNTIGSIMNRRMRQEKEMIKTKLEIWKAETGYAVYT